jgi:hypothetical protein
MSQLLVQRACAKLRSAIGDETVQRMNLTGDLQEMLDALEVIQPGLEEDDSQLTDDRSEKITWLRNFRLLPYGIMDIVDELQYTTAPASATVCAVTPHLFSDKLISLVPTDRVFRLL